LDPGHRLAADLGTGADKIAQNIAGLIDYCVVEVLRLITMISPSISSVFWP